MYATVSSSRGRVFNEQVVCACRCFPCYREPGRNRPGCSRQGQEAAKRQAGNVSCLQDHAPVYQEDQGESDHGQDRRQDLLLLRKVQDAKTQIVSTRSSSPVRSASEGPGFFLAIVSAGIILRIETEELEWNVRSLWSSRTQWNAG